MDAWKENKEISDALENMQEADKLRKEAESLERNAKEVRQKEYDSLKELYEDKKRQLEKLKEEEKEQQNQMKKYLQHACEELRHVYKVKEEEAIGSAIGHTFLGNIYHVKGIRKCVVCGKEESYDLRKTLSFSRLTGSYPKIPETHQKILTEAHAKYKARIEKELRQKEEEIKEIESRFRKLCESFGHDDQNVWEGDNGYRVCKCCGRRELMAERFPSN